MEAKNPEGIHQPVFELDGNAPLLTQDLSTEVPADTLEGVLHKQDILELH